MLQKRHNMCKQTWLVEWLTLSTHLGNVQLKYCHRWGDNFDGKVIHTCASDAEVFTFCLGFVIDQGKWRYYYN